MNNTLIKGLLLLEVLARSDRPLGVTELATRLGIVKSGVHRLLQALIEMRYVVRDESTSSYRASIRLWELGSAVLSHFDLRHVATPRMETLLQQTRETVHLSILDGDEVVYVHKIDSPEPVRAYSEIGGRAPAYCVATGKALLAFEHDVFLSALAQRLQRHTARTITDPARFLREMEGVRSAGYAVNRGEWRETVCGIAAPIRGSSGQVIAAIGVSGPAARIKPASFKPLAVQVAAAAASISEALSSSAPPDPLTMLLGTTPQSPRRPTRKPAVAAS